MNNKVYLKESELKDITMSAVKKALQEKLSYQGVRKANRKGSRDAEKDIYGDGFKAKEKVHSSQKAYKRNEKYGTKAYFDNEDGDNTINETFVSGEINKKIMEVKNLVLQYFDENKDDKFLKGTPVYEQMGNDFLDSHPEYDNEITNYFNTFVFFKDLCENYGLD